MRAAGAGAAVGVATAATARSPRHGLTQAPALLLWTFLLKQHVCLIDSSHVSAKYRAWG